MFLTLLILTLCLSMAACPRWLTGARVVTREGVAKRLHPWCLTGHARGSWWW